MLVAVAVVSGLVWGLVRAGGGSEGVPGAPQAGPPSSDPLNAGEFSYEVVAGPTTDTDCSANSYGQMVDWFAEHPCENVFRGLYITTEGEARALVSVVLVTMPDASQAQQLKAVTDTDATGNIEDLARNGTVNLPKAPSVARGEYHSQIDGHQVTIVEANFYDEHSDPELLRTITADAAKLTEHLTAG